MREEEVQRFKELPELIEKLFKLLFVVIGFMATTIGEQFSEKHPIVFMAMAVLIVLYFALWLLGTMLGHLNDRLPKILSWIMLLIGLIFSVLVLAILNSVLAWIGSLLLLGILGVISYYHSQELYQLFVSPVSDIIHRFVARYRGQQQEADHSPV